MHVSGGVLLLKVGMAREAELVCIVDQDQLIGKAVSLVAGFAVLGLDRIVNVLL